MSTETIEVTGHIVLITRAALIQIFGNLHAIDDIDTGNGGGGLDDDTHCGVRFVRLGELFFAALLDRLDRKLRGFEGRLVVLTFR